MTKNKKGREVLQHQATHEAATLNAGQRAAYDRLTRDFNTLEA